MSLNKKEHDYFYPQLVNRYGEFCLLCYKTPLANPNDKANYVHRLLIHESVYERPINIDNLRLLCDSCNQTIHPPRTVNYKRKMTPEMERSFEKEPLAREYMLNRVKYDEKVERDQLIASAAEKARCSIKACKGYYEKLTSDEGPLVEQWNGAEFMIYEKGKQPNLKYDIMTGSFIEVPRESSTVP